MAKIKKKVRMTLPELITWAWENDVREEWFYSDNQAQKSSYGVQFDEDGDFISRLALNSDLLFTVEVKEEITEETNIAKLVSINRNNLNEVNINFDCSIGQFIDRSDYNYYILNDDSTLTLIWKDGELV